MLVDIVVICLDATIGDLLPRLAEAAVSAYKEAGIHVADDDVLRVLLVKAVAHVTGHLNDNFNDISPPTPYETTPNHCFRVLYYTSVTV